MAQYLVRMWVEVEADSPEQAHRKAVAGDWEFDAIDEDGIVLAEEV